jgi:hypothetical protein
MGGRRARRGSDGSRDLHGNRTAIFLFGPLFRHLRSPLAPSLALRLAESAHTHTTSKTLGSCDISPGSEYQARSLLMLMLSGKYGEHDTRRWCLVPTWGTMVLIAQGMQEDEVFLGCLGRRACIFPSHPFICVVILYMFSQGVCFSPNPNWWVA